MAFFYIENDVAPAFRAGIVVVIDAHIDIDGPHRGPSVPSSSERRNVANLGRLFSMAARVLSPLPPYLGQSSPQRRALLNATRRAQPNATAGAAPRQTAVRGQTETIDWVGEDSAPPAFGW